MMILSVGCTLPTAHGKRFGSSGSFIEQRGIRHVERRQFCHHCLIIEQVLEATLSDFRLIRRVLSVPVRGKRNFHSELYKTALIRHHSHHPGFSNKFLKIG